MGDLISKQAAIDAVLDSIPDDEYWNEQVKKAINALPSAQPEIIHCKDCKFFEELHDGVGYCERDKNSDYDYHDVCGLVKGSWYCADGERSE